MQGQKDRGGRAMAARVLIGTSQALSAQNHDRAEQILPPKVNALLLHAIERPVWLPSGRLSYQTRTAGGLSLMLADPARGSRQQIFGESGIPRAALAGESPSASAAVCNNLSVAPSEQGVIFQLGARRWQCDLEGNDCQPVPAIDLAATSPTGEHEAFVRDHNLWVRSTVTGEETQLTTDGVEDFGYATDNAGRQHSNRAIVRWSPDSRRIATFQQDQRAVGEMYLTRTQRGHPELSAWKYALAGDAVIPVVHRVVIDVAERRVVRLKMPADLVRSATWYGLTYPRSGQFEVQWTADSEYVTFVSLSRDHKVALLRVADVLTGEVREVLEERTRTYYHSALSFWHAMASDAAPNWRCLPASREVIWYSGRDNWSHLYLYDLDTGRLKHQITRGDWNVVQVVNVDERERVIYFLAVGRELERHPYFEHLYRMGFDGTGLTLLTPEDASHSICMQPSGDYFLDGYSRVDAAPVAIVRDRTGKLVQTIEIADISQLASAGWRPPEYITVKARDGVTDLYGLMFRPSYFNEGEKYPIVNSIYSGPILGSVIPDVSRCLQWGGFATSHGLLEDAQSLAELGFIVVMIDGLGTPLRSRTFHEATYGNYGDATLPDQVAAMKELARRHPWIQIDRAGIYGHSHGGYAAARAMLMYPDFFRAGISISGNHDPTLYQDEYYEKFVDECTAADPVVDNMSLAENLRGRLFLIHGTLDDCVVPTHTLLMVQALIAADKDFDLLMLPNETHGIESEEVRRYLIRRVKNYFVRHLQGVEPPR